MATGSGVATEDAGVLLFATGTGSTAAIANATPLPTLKHKGGCCGHNSARIASNLAANWFLSILQLN